MTDRRSIRTLADVLALTPEERERFVPDFIAWLAAAALAEEHGLRMEPEMAWVDDGRSGDISAIVIKASDGSVVEEWNFPPEAAL